MPPKITTRPSLDELRNLYVTQQFSSAEIGAMFHVTNVTILNWLRRDGTPIYDGKTERSRAKQRVPKSPEQRAKISASHLARWKAKAETETERVCRKCGLTKPVAEFRPIAHNVNGRLRVCMTCESTYQKRWRDSAEGWPEHMQAIARLERYGITIEQYDTLFAEQHGLCAICGEPQQAKRSSIRNLDVDHDHLTGQVRGLLCNHCNAAIAHAQHDPRILAAAIAYLERWSQTPEPAPMLPRRSNHPPASQSNRDRRRLDPQ